MPRTLTQRSRRLGALTILALGALVLSGCASNAPDQRGDETSSESARADWPRTFENADGTTTEIPAKPEHIVSTSVSVSGTLLAFDAPLVASGSAGNGNFFAQWADIARERGVENLWSAGDVDIEAIYNYNPDLIVVSTTGADSVMDQIAALTETGAPVIVVDYGGQTWQDLARQLGAATGLEDKAEATITDFDAYVVEAAEKITVPKGTANVVSFNGAAESNPIARIGSAQGKLLTQLGFTLEDPDVAWHTQDSVRQDFVWASYENLTELTSETTFILSKDNARAQGFADDPVLANLPSVQAGQVFGLGANSFRIDMYSATEIVDSIVENFAR